MITAIVVAGAVLLMDAISNVYLGKLLLQQSRLLTQATQVLNASINTVSALAEKVADLCRKEDTNDRSQTP
jgi:hypothetical protein